MLINNNIIDAAAAGIAIVPVFYGFQVKTAQQLQEARPKFSILQALKGGFKASPVLGTQIIVQDVLKDVFKQKFHKEDIWTKLASTITVACFSSPVLAVFNGKTMGKSLSESLRSFSRKQGGAIIARETSFLFSLTISGEVGKEMRGKFGESRFVESISHFATGAIASLIGHPFDTMLTLSQKGKTVTIRDLPRGAPVKAITVGFFLVIYQVGKEILS